MLQRTYEQVIKSGAKQIIIATDDNSIRELAHGFGAKVFMTSSRHRSGTERVQQVITEMKLDGNEVVVNVQADEPLIPPSAIDRVAKSLIEREETGISTLCELISDNSEINNPNAVKVVMNNKSEALYFSRAPIPHNSDKNLGSYYRHIGIYAYRVKVLHQFVGWPVSELEASENLEQLRALQNGIRIHVDISRDKIPAGIDTEKDLELVRKTLSSTNNAPQ
jgi:3-deoxy-manno-octulosonate cytidylyltransferase (CMP-KDO synthetase)